MDNLRSATKTVKRVLEDNPDARNNEYLLLHHTYKAINDDVLSMPFEDVLLEFNDLGIPKFETVRRARQKIQATYPNLAGCSKVTAQRLLNEKIFREYARE